MGDRIVVMKDGIIQQVDTPQNLYDCLLYTSTKKLCVWMYRVKYTCIRQWCGRGSR